MSVQRPDYSAGWGCHESFSSETYQHAILPFPGGVRSLTKFGSLSNFGQSARICQRPDRAREGHVVLPSTRLVFSGDPHTSVSSAIATQPGNHASGSARIGGSAHPHSSSRYDGMYLRDLSTPSFRAAALRNVAICSDRFRLAFRSDSHRPSGRKEGYRARPITAHLHSPPRHFADLRISGIRILVRRDGGGHPSVSSCLMEQTRRR